MIWNYLSGIINAYSMFKVLPFFRELSTRCIAFYNQNLIVSQPDIYGLVVVVCGHIIFNLYSVLTGLFRCITLYMPVFVPDRVVH